MKRILITLSIVAAFILASCSLNISMNFSEPVVKNEPPKVVYGKLNGYEILEHRLIIGYENREAAEKLTKELRGRIYLELPKINAIAIEIPEKVEDALKKLKAMKLEGIRYVEPSYRRYIIDPVPSSAELRSFRSESEDEEGEEEFWSELWGLQKINAKAAWDAGYTGADVIVAVVDTPIDCQHPDLEGQCVTGFDPEASTTIPATADYEDPENPEDDHGTHVAGTIAAKRDGKGVVGLAYGAKIMSIVIFKGTDDKKSYYYVGDEYVASGIIWAVDHGASVLSNSWGGGGYSYTLKAAIDYALSKGAVFVAAAGNGHTDQHWHYPSAYPGVIAVAASTARDEIVNFSNRGDYISVAAPGVNILSTIPHKATYGIYGKPYDYWGGTSMATPHVSALVAILKQKYPDATPYQIKKMIENSAVDIEEPGWDHAAGYGRIDVAAALEQSPDDYKGANYHVLVKSKDGNFGIPAALVTLKRKSGDGSDYYAATNENGVASFYGIDPAEYDVIIGGPDLYEINSPVLRMEEQTGTSYSTSLSAGEATDVVLFDTEIDLMVEMKNASDVLNLVDPYSYYVLGTIVDLATQTATETEQILSWTIHAGQVLLMYELSEPASTDTTVSGTAIVNGEEIPIYGVISEGATYTFMDEWGGEEPPAWWTAF